MRGILEACLIRETEEQMHPTSFYHRGHAVSHVQLVYGGNLSGVFEALEKPFAAAGSPLSSTRLVRGFGVTRRLALMIYFYYSVTIYGPVEKS